MANNAVSQNSVPRMEEAPRHVLALSQSNGHLLQETVFRMIDTYGERMREALESIQPPNARVQAAIERLNTNLLFGTGSLFSSNSGPAQQSPNDARLNEIFHYLREHCGPNGTQDRLAATMLRVLGDHPNILQTASEQRGVMIHQLIGDNGAAALARQAVQDIVRGPSQGGPPTRIQSAEQMLRMLESTSLPPLEQAIARLQEGNPVRDQLADVQSHILTHRRNAGARLVPALGGNVRAGAVAPPVNPAAQFILPPPIPPLGLVLPPVQLFQGLGQPRAQQPGRAAPARVRAVPQVVGAQTHPEPEEST